MKDNLKWKILVAAVALLALLTFTPLITPAGKYQPMLWGMPFTLWVGILQALLLVGLTWLGTRIRRKEEETQLPN